MTQTATQIHNPAPFAGRQFTVHVNSLDRVHSYYSPMHPLWVASVRQYGEGIVVLCPNRVRLHGKVYRITPAYTPVSLRQGNDLRFTLTSED